MIGVKIRVPDKNENGYVDHRVVLSRPWTHHRLINAAITSRLQSPASVRE